VVWINLAQGTIQWQVALSKVMQDQLRKAEVRFTLEQIMKARGEYKYGSTLSLTSVIDGVGWSTARPCRFSLGTFYKRVGESQRRPGRMRKISPQQ